MPGNQPIVPGPTTLSSTHSESSSAARLTWRPGAGQRRPLLVVAVTAVFLAALVLRLWPLHGWATDYDEGVYWQSLQAMDRGHALFSQVFSSQPPLFLWSVYPLYDAFGETLSTARLAVVLYSLAGIAAMYFLGRAIGGPRVGLLAAVLLAADPLYLWASHTLVAEVPALAAELLSLALIAEAARHPSRVQKMLAAGAGVAMGLGIMTKLSTIVGVVPSAAFLFFQPLELPGRRGAQARRETGRRPSAPRVIAGCLAYGAGVVAGIGLALWPFRSHLHQVQSQILGFHLAASGVMGGSLKGNLAMVLKLPAEVALGALAGIAVWRAVVKRATFVVPAALWFVATFGFLLMLRPLWYHHLVLLAPPLVLVASLSFAPFDRLEGRTGRDRIGQTSSHGAPYVIKVMAGIAVVVGLGGGLLDRDGRPVPSRAREPNRSPTTG